jgi:CHASE2 domain-containing sensor protein
MTLRTFLADPGRRATLRTLVAGLCAGLTALLIAWTLPQVVSFEHWITDWRTVLLSERKDRQSAQVAVVAIDARTLSRYPYLSPIDRGLLAEVLEAVAASKPRAIAIDIVFDRPTEAAKDRRLLAAVRAAPVDVVLGRVGRSSGLDPESEAWQADFLARSGRLAGFLNLGSSTDGMVRHIPPRDGGECAFAEVAAGYAGAAGPGGSGCDRRRRPLRIDWLLPPRSGEDVFATLSAGDLLSPRLAPMLRQFLAGRIVLIGADLPPNDMHPSPLSLGEGLPGTSGLHIQAQAVQQLVDRRFLRELNPAGEVLLLLVSGVVGAVLASKRRLRLRAALLLFAVTWGLVALDALLYVSSRFVLSGDLAAFGVLLGLAFNAARYGYDERGTARAVRTAGEVVL